MKSDGTPNPDHRPDWEELHDRATRQRDEAMGSLRALWTQKLGPHDPTVMHLQREITEANDICCHALLTWQHPTLEDCRNFFNRFVDDPKPFDCSRMTSVMDVLGEIERRREDRWTTQLLMPLAPPHSGGPFSDPRQVVHIERICRHSEPFRFEEHTFEGTVQVLYSVLRERGHLHVAMQNVDATENSVINAAECLIEYFRTHVLPTLPQRFRLSWRTTFYTYIRPSCSAKEIFDRIVLHGNWRSHGVSWRSIAVLPAAIRPTDLPGSQMTAGRRLF
jgi:hypothetical protein